MKNLTGFKVKDLAQDKLIDEAAKELAEDAKDGGLRQETAAAGVDTKSTA